MALKFFGKPPKWDVEYSNLLQNCMSAFINESMFSLKPRLKQYWS
jgi:hypothetical protein